MKTADLSIHSMFMKVSQDAFGGWQLYALFHFPMSLQFLKGIYSFPLTNQAVLKANKLFEFCFKDPCKHVIFLSQISFFTELKLILFITSFWT